MVRQLVTLQGIPKGLSQITTGYLTAIAMVNQQIKVWDQCNMQLYSAMATGIPKSGVPNKGLALEVGRKAHLRSGFNQ
jgi:hypothetical protein